MARIPVTELSYELKKLAFDMIASSLSSVRDMRRLDGYIGYRNRRKIFFGSHYAYTMKAERRMLERLASSVQMHCDEAIYICNYDIIDNDKEFLSRYYPRVLFLDRNEVNLMAEKKKMDNRARAILKRYF